MNEVFAFRLIGAVACLLAAFMIFVFFTLVRRGWQERRRPKDIGRASDD